MEDKSLYENIRLNKAFNNYKKIVAKSYHINSLI